MTLLADPKKPARLAAGDWIVTALAVLKDSGIDAVQITTLAKRLSVTRGSFYWHFDNREDLLTALISEWRARNTGVMIEAIRDVDCLDHGILALFSVWVDHTRFDAQLDQAIRDWARHDEPLREVVKSEDDARVAAIARFFARHDYPEAEAFIRARVIYFTQISFYALHVDDDKTMAQRLGYLNEYFRCFTGRDIDQSIAAAYRAANMNDHDHDTN
jgi:AcrR family transcriptional regulator